MRYQRDKRNMMTGYLSSWMPTILFLFYALFLLTPIAIAQKMSADSAHPLKINGKEVKEYLIEKYKLRKHDVSSTLQHTPYGPEGKLHLRGDIVPKYIANAKEIKNREDRARAMAKVFLEEEAGLFGITNMDEIRKVKTNTIQGYKGQVTSVHYRRYINNVELENMYVRVTIGPDETITSVGAELIPTPPELYEAVKKKILTEGEILKIVKQDLESAGVDPKEMRVLSIEKAAIPSSPYVIWKVDVNLKKSGGRWKYRIDAFTGEILEKRDALIIN